MEPRLKSGQNSRSSSQTQRCNSCRKKYKTAEISAILKHSLF